MFSQDYDSNNKQFSLYITIKCSGQQKFTVIAEDFEKQFSEYANRNVLVDGEKTIFIPFPVSPKKITLIVQNTANPSDTSFTVQVEPKKLRTYDIWLCEDAISFLPMAIQFSQTCGFSKANPNGAEWKTSDDKFRIKYYPIIKDVATGQVYNTPARIGHNTGIIEVAKAKFDNYTIPMRLIILLHEFSHKYKNPKLGLEISNEIGADINALYIYLGLGFSKIDAICVFANVFLKAQTPQNIQRMRKIMEYIKKFEDGQYAKQNILPEYV